MSQGQLIEYETYLLLGHFFVIIIILFGWTFRSTRLWSRWVVYLTVFFWVAVGLAIGDPGYCPLTEWMWDIKRELGEKDLPHSFITYALRQYGFTPIEWKVELFSWVVLMAIFALCLLMQFIERFERLREEAAKGVVAPPPES